MGKADDTLALNTAIREYGAKCQVALDKTPWHKWYPAGADVSGICEGCPLATMVACYRWAQKNSDATGVWGGKMFRSERDESVLDNQGNYVGPTKEEY